MPDIITNAFEDRRFLIISSEDLERILGEAELLEEIDTSLNKTIRLLQYHGRRIFPEYSFDGDIVVRPMESREAADALVQSRLDTYERMWDGCGCKINFFE